MRGLSLALLATAGAVVTVPMTKKRRGTAGERPGSLGAQHGVQRSSTAIKSRLGEVRGVGTRTLPPFPVRVHPLNRPACESL